MSVNRMTVAWQPADRRVRTNVMEFVGDPTNSDMTRSADELFADGLW
jgi:hypothetical protein